MSSRPAPFVCRRHVLLLAAAAGALAAAVLPVLPAGAAAAEAPRLSRHVVPAAPDFATAVYGDAWDMEQASDLRHTRHHTVNVSDLRVSGGVARLEATGISFAHFVFPGFPGALHLGREGGHQPIDGSTYTHATLRIRPSRGVAMSFQYDRALAQEGRDRDSRTVSLGMVAAGWQTVTVPMGWSGPVYALGLSMATGSGDTVEIDYLRLHPAPEAVEVLYDASGGARLYWDLDAEPANNSPDNPGWGLVPTGTPGRAVFNAGAHTPGTYRFYTDTGTSRSAYSESLDVNAPPAPFILDPDLAGGEDYATTHLGRPWDFRDASDVVAMANMQHVTFGSAGLTATNGPPNQNDPYFYLRIGPRGIDPNKYHRLTVRTTYDGPYDLGDFAGGGTHGRLGWAGGEDVHNPNERPGPGRADIIQGNRIVQAKEVVHHPEESFSVDLRTTPPSAVMELDMPSRQGWPGAPIHYLRYDPNEDRGARRWRISSIELRATDATRDNFFDITWQDANEHPADQVRVSLSYDTDRAGFDGTPIAADLAQTPGVNTYRWQTAQVPPGRYWIHAVATDGVSTSRAYSSGPVDVRANLRVRGPDRVATAIELSKLGFPQGAPAVVVARDRDFPDALAAAPLAAAARGPLLLNPVASLRAGVREEITRLGARTVYLMGGTAAQSPDVEHALRQIPGVQVIRVSGADRFHTAAAAAQRAVGLWRQQGHAAAGSTVLVALGTDFPDALGAGPLAGHARQPLLLAQRGSVPQATLDALHALGARQVTVVGGSAAISDEAAASLGRPVRRLAGATRFETAGLAAVEAVRAGADPHVLIVASGRNFADALASAPAAIGRGGVLLLTEPTSLSPVTRQWVAERRGRMRLLRLAGGVAAVSDPVEDALAAAAR